MDRLLSRRYSHRTIDGVRVSIDADYRVCVVDDSGAMLVTLGTVRPHPTTSRRWLATPEPDLATNGTCRIPSTGADYTTQADAIGDMLMATVWGK